MKILLFIKNTDENSEKIQRFFSSLCFTATINPTIKVGEKMEDFLLVELNAHNNFSEVYEICKTFEKANFFMESSPFVKGECSRYKLKSNDIPTVNFESEQSLEESCDTLFGNKEITGNNVPFFVYEKEGKVIVFSYLSSQGVNRDDWYKIIRRIQKIFPTKGFIAYDQILEIESKKL